MITAHLHGGLGNQLFQIAACLAVAWDNDDIAVFDFNAHKLPSQGNQSNKYRYTIFKNLQSGKVSIGNKFYEEWFQYNPIPYSSGLEIIGLSYSEKYFPNHRDRLIETFGLQIKPIDKVSIHVRRGDFAKPEYEVCYILPIEYYQQVISKFRDDTEFIVISDDIEWCKAVFPVIFPDSNFTYSEGNTDLDDLLLMASCEHNIIANSSFSWWSSYFNPNPNKLVYAPSKWLDKRNGKEVYQDDIYSDWMIKL
jgi:hypothetical protein